MRGHDATVRPAPSTRCPPVYERADSCSNIGRRAPHGLGGAPGAARTPRGLSDGSNVVAERPEKCAEEDSNLHGGIPPQGPQPCASTNSATGAGRRSIGALDFRPPARLACANTCSPPRPSSTRAKELRHDGPDQAPAGDLRLHQALLGGARLSADRARHRQGRRASRRRRRCTRISRTSRSSACCAATRRSRGRSSCSTAPSSRSRSIVRPDGPAARRAGRRRLADARRGEHRGVRRGAAARRRRGRRVRPARARRVDDRRRHPGGRLRRRASAGDRASTARSSSRCVGRGGDRQALLPRVRPHPAAARERRDGADPLPRRARSSGASSACSGACRDGHARA